MDMRSFAKGFLTGSLVTVAGAGAAYLYQQYRLQGQALKHYETMLFNQQQAAQAAAKQQAAESNNINK